MDVDEEGKDEAMEGEEGQDEDDKDGKGEEDDDIPDDMNLDEGEVCDTGHVLVDR